MRRPFVITASIIVIVLSAAVQRVPAEQSTSAQTELLTEVRLLRQAIESLAGTNARVQIVFGRLQLQEQRTATAAKRAEDARAAFFKLTQEMSFMADRAKQVEEVINDNRGKPEELEQMRAEVVMIKRQLDQMETERVRLAGDETEAATTLNQEQGRWSDLNRQLDDLERTLAKR